MFDDLGVGNMQGQLNKLIDDLTFRHQQQAALDAAMNDTLKTIGAGPLPLEGLLSAGTIAADYIDSLGIANAKQFVSVWPSEPIRPAFDQVQTALDAIGSAVRGFETSLVANGVQDALASIQEYSGLAAALPDLSWLIEHWERVERGEQALSESEFAYSKLFWTETFLAQLGRQLPEKVADGVASAVVDAVSFDGFGEMLLEDVQGSGLLRRRKPLVDAVIRAHREKLYGLSVPVAMTQVEGCLGDLLWLRNAVEIDGHKLWWKNPSGGGKGKKVDGMWELADRLSKRDEVEEEPLLVGVTQAVANRLNKDRNAILHGRMVDFAEDQNRSAELLLVLAMLVFSTGSFEEDVEQATEA